MDLPPASHHNLSENQDIIDGSIDFVLSRPPATPSISTIRQNAPDARYNLKMTTSYRIDTCILERKLHACAT